MISICVTTYNGAWRLGNLLKSIHMRTPELFSGEACVVVVDDGSPVVDQTRRVVEEWRGRMPLHYHEHGSNRGISAGWNTAARAVSCDYAVEVNDDVIVSSGWLASVIHPLKHSPGVGVVGQSFHAFVADDVTALLEEPDSDQRVTPRDLLTKRPAPERRTMFEDTNPGRVMCPTGQLFAFRRGDFDAIGGFDEGYKSFYEESDFGTSMAAKLRKIGVQVNWPFNWHMWSATFSANPELLPSERLSNSKEHYRRKWGVPDSAGEFDHTNAVHFRTIPDVPVEFIRKSGAVARGILRQDGAFVETT